MDKTNVLSALDTGYLRHVKTIDIKATSGDRLIYEAPRLFGRFIDYNFEAWGLTQKAPQKPAGKIEIYELYKKGTIEQFIMSFKRPLAELYLTDDQIIDICLENSADLIEEPYANFFLINKTVHEDNPFVVDVFLAPDGLGAAIFKFDDSYQWSGLRPHRFFIPSI